MHELAAETTVWDNALRSIAGRVKPHNYDLWLRPIRCTAIDSGSIRLHAPNRYIKEWFEDNYLEIVLEAIHDLTDRDYGVVFEVDAVESLVERSAHPAPAAQAAPPQPGTRYTFEAFVVGAENRIARDAALQVAEAPGTRFNPVWLYGGIGLGKTHLCHAIGHQLRHTRPDLKVSYVAGERFMNEYVNAVRRGHMDEFRRRYREQTDVLLVDDIQFLAGKDRTQDEFFHTFNALHQAGRQIVLTSDRTPPEIDHLEDRLKSRFQWGLIADIHTPGESTRLAIVRHKAEADGIDLPEDVAAFLASSVRSNVRELEGALIRLAAYSSLHGCPITMEFARLTLGSVLRSPTELLGIDAVQKEVANHFNLKVADLKGPKRHQSVARARQIAMYLARRLCQASFPEIGRHFGGKDHSTVISACRKIERLFDQDPATRNVVEQLLRHLRP
jgi:chromosomal replication initiator protein